MAAHLTWNKSPRFFHWTAQPYRTGFLSDLISFEKITPSLTLLQPPGLLLVFEHYQARCCLRTFVFAAPSAWNTSLLALPSSYLKDSFPPPGLTQVSAFPFP